MDSNNAINTNLIKIDYNELIDPNSNLIDNITQAFGINGLGLICIKNIPNYSEIRKDILKKGFEMANLDQDYLQTLEKPETNYSLGYQKGKSFFGGKWEALTGAFYARVLNEQIDHSDPEMKKKYTNIWPSEEKLQGFKNSFLKMGKLLTHCQESLLLHLEKYVKSCYPKYEEGSIYNKLKARNDAISRLIMYHPAKTYDETKYGAESKDNWCGWHRDFGIVTGLAHPIYFKDNEEVVEGIGSGLIVKDRKNQLHNITFGEDEILIQSGDCSFIMTGGTVIATPHCVKITEDMPKDVYRITFVNFYDPCFEEVIDLPKGIEKEMIKEKDPLGLKYMLTKFNEPCTYGELIKNAFNNYYSANKKE
jgi:isopenicillin N synthase-like dioxygenase